jgi:Transposase DDE domain.
MNNPLINDKLKEGILGYRSSVRNWSKYNKSLVERMFSLLDTNSLYKWKHSLEEENKCKRGRPFKVPDVLINFLAKIRSIYSIPFRSLESILKIFSGIMGLNAIHYTSIFRRIRNMEVMNTENNSENIECAIDSTGFKITIRGDYLGNKWKRDRKGWAKLHVIVDINEIRALTFSITDEHIHDSIEALNLVNRIRDKASKLCGYKAIIPLMKNHSTLSRGSPYRARIAREIRRTSESQWKNNNNYGKRWIVEIYFSGLKSVMGEIIKAKRHQYIAQEISKWLNYYNIMRNMAEAY